MKFRDSHGQDVIVTWGDHWPGCDKCREVVIEKSATFANACAQGSPLLMEELAKRQAPAESAKRKAVEEWATKAGTFIKSKAKNVPMKYKEE